MITIKTLTWSNAFSYGADNTLDFSSAQLTQLVGKNGHGKSSIALVLEEVLFNKNSKSIKKADILNRYVKDKSYSISLVFDKDGTEYRIDSKRGTTQTVKLYKSGVDISAHTATQTYKNIEEILGFDHKTFSQIVYQSNAGSLEFLTAPDTARKKFLIEILNLGKYTRAQEVFKETAQELSKDITAVQSQVNTVSAWLDKYAKADLTPLPLQAVEAIDGEQLLELEQLSSSIKNIESTNKKISQNNTYKQLQAKIKLFPIPEKPTEDTKPLQAEAGKLNTESVELAKTLRDSQAFVKKIGALHGTCPTCLQEIDEAKIAELIAEQQKIQDNARESNLRITARITELDSLRADIAERMKTWESANRATEEWEKYHTIIDTTMQEDLLDKEQLEAQFTELQASITTLKAAIARAEKHNTTASAHNAKVEIISKQMVEMNEELEAYSEKLHELSERMSIVNVLTKTFSTTGLVAYKIECLVKDLEEITNQYLVDLSDGRFQIGFKVSASDKLNVVITDNGRDIEMLALSGGERARVNVATLLAIRKLMQTLSSSRINLLILDETVEALDVDGKERLIEVLLREEHLNTFLVSHGFSHPLLEKVNVVKSNNISQIEV
jgi:DNA repair exonuclease SbcCD ATPase subunit